MRHLPGLFFAPILLLTSLMSAGCAGFSLESAERPPKPAPPGIPLSQLSHARPPFSAAGSPSTEVALDRPLSFDARINRYLDEATLPPALQRIPRMAVAVELPLPSNLPGCLRAFGRDVTEAAPETGRSFFIAGVALTESQGEFPVRWDVLPDGSIEGFVLGTRSGEAFCVAPNGLVGGFDKFGSGTENVPAIWTLRGDEIEPLGIYESGAVVDISATNGALVVTDRGAAWWKNPTETVWIRGFTRAQKDVEVLAMSETGLLVGTIDARTDRPKAAYWTEYSAYGLPNMEDEAAIGTAVSISPDGSWVSGISTTGTGYREVARWHRDLYGDWRLQVADQRRPVIGVATQIMNYGLTFGQYTGRRENEPAGAFAWDDQGLTPLQHWLELRGVKSENWEELINVTGAARAQDRVLLVGIGRLKVDDGYGKASGYFINAPALLKSETSK